MRSKGATVSTFIEYQSYKVTSYKNTTDRGPGTITPRPSGPKILNARNVLTALSPIRPSKPIRIRPIPQAIPYSYIRPSPSSSASSVSKSSAFPTPHLSTNRHGIFNSPSPRDIPQPVRVPVSKLLIYLYVPFTCPTSACPSSPHNGRHQAPGREQDLLRRLSAW